MSSPVLISETLNRALDGQEILGADLHQLCLESADDATELFRVSRILREKTKGRTISYTRNVFVNAVNLCRDICSYCTYRAEPGSAKESMMPVSNVRQLLKAAKRCGCIEALFVTGERPEAKYAQAREWLRQEGFTSTAEYLTHCSEIAVSEGLFPHTNAGNLTAGEMRELRKTNSSMGLMLETASDRLAEPGMPHHLAPSKMPVARLEVLENAGRLQIPMTTGILVGIGENPGEMIDSILAIRSLHQRYGHIQEVILQNFQPKPDTIMRAERGAGHDYFKRIVSITRVAMPDMNIQIPPNLSPDSYSEFLHAGINDWGGISPLTLDYVNPEFPWPHLNAVADSTKSSGFTMSCRFPVYPEFFGMLHGAVREQIAEFQDKDGFVRE